VNEERQKAVERLFTERLKRKLASGGAACPDAEILAAYVDRTLAQRQRASFETHAASCRRCQEAVATLVSVAESDEPVRLPAPSKRRARHSDWWAAWRWAWAAPLLLAVVIVGVWRIGDFRSRIAEPQKNPVSPEALSQPAKDQRVSGSAKVAAPPPPAALRNVPAAKPREKQAEAAGPRRDISKERTAEAKTQVIPGMVPSPAPLATDKITTSGGMAPPSVRARLEAPAPTPQTTAQGTSQGAGAGVAAPGAPGGGQAAQANAITEQPKPTAAESSEKKNQTATGTLAREKGLSSVQEMEVTAAPAKVLGVAPASKFQGSDWIVVRTRNTGTWRVGLGGGIEKLGKHGRWAVVPSNVTVDLYNLAFFDASEGWIVGQSGTVLHTTDGGKTWTSVTSPTATDLVQVTATAKSTVQVTARDASIFSTTDGGATWNSSTRP
jgi:photosynthesis system II assembly factor YCF48-like protein/putative zinc finger protein